MKIRVLSQYHPASVLHNPRLWSDLLEDWEHFPEIVPHDFTVVKEPSDVGAYYALDTENSPDGKIGEWSIAYRNQKTGRLEVCSYMGTQDGNIIKKLDATCVMHNAKWDIRVLKNNRMPVPKNIVCTMIAAYCLGLGKQDVKDSAKNKSGDQMVGGLGLKYLARRHLGMTMLTWEQVKDHPELKEEYNANDSISTFLLWEKWLPRIPQHFWDIDMPLLEVLMAMEDRGIAVDPAFLKVYASELDSALNEIELPLNAFSPPQLQSYIYGTLGIEPWKFTDTGAPSTDIDVLEAIDDPIVKKIVEYKQLYQEKSTYADGYLKTMDSGGRIHSEFKQTSTATGRLSSAKPNMQNVMKTRGSMRKLFVAPAGMKLIRVDWKKIEFGMLAVLTGDDELINAFVNGNIHQETADSLGIDYDTGKHITFLVQNGGTPWGMSQEYDIPLEEAKSHFEKYFKRFPAIKRFHDKTVEEAKATKKVSSPWGRERRLNAQIAQDWRVRRDGEKEAKTMPMQSGAAELVKLAMIALHRDHNAPMLIQVHDELLFEVPEDEAEDYAEFLKEFLPKVTTFRGVPFDVEVGIGDTWLEASEKGK